MTRIVFMQLMVTQPAGTRPRLRRLPGPPNVPARPGVEGSGTAPADPAPVAGERGGHAQGARGGDGGGVRRRDGTGPGGARYPTGLASGAAGRALECDGRIFDGAGPDGWGDSDGADTPEEGPALWLDLFQPNAPGHGYRMERRERNRVLYSFDVGGRTKVAVVVAEDQQDRPGWGPETSASCDPAERPARYAAAWGREVWTDRHGRRVPVSRLNGSTGSAHCGRQSVRFLALDGATYARDPDGVLGESLLTAPYRAHVRMPAGAHDTGYRHRHRRLWLTADRSTAYVRTPMASRPGPG
ncbi:hypothetical protein AB0N17_14120 [Streptomyces sp. NPDC051133]|uniref:hypothetical protein n=1 Tax=Streptomyces sp. NPDC051133 TaxID=3155521 RepID=UPI00342ACCDA